MTWILVILLSFSCNKEATIDEKKEKKPSYTGKFYLEFDGKPLHDDDDKRFTWKASGTKFGDNYLGMTPKLYFTSEDGHKKKIYHFFMAIQPVKTGKQSFYTHNRQAHMYRMDDIPCGTYYVDQRQEHQTIVTTVDENKQIVKGRFNFVAVNKCQDTIRITNGKFDIPYKQR